MKIRGQLVIPPRDRIETMSIPEPNSGCWIWLGGTASSPCGLEYGRLSVGSRGFTRRTVRAHRYSYETYKGPIPEGLNVCHHCDISLCVNPDHLFVGTQSDNMVDAFAKGRVDPPHNNRKLTPAMIAEAIELHAAGMGWRRLGGLYGVHKETLKEAINCRPAPPLPETEG
jgi:hypothetical protein